MDVILQLIGARFFADFLTQHPDVSTEWSQSDRILGFAAAHAAIS